MLKGEKIDGVFGTGKTLNSGDIIIIFMTLGADDIVNCRTQRQCVCLLCRPRGKGQGLPLNIHHYKDETWSSSSGSRRLWSRCSESDRAEPGDQGYARCEEVFFIIRMIIREIMTNNCNMIKSVRCRYNKMVFYVEACESGSMFKVSSNNNLENRAVFDPSLDIWQQTQFSNNIGQICIFVPPGSPWSKPERFCHDSQQCHHIILCMLLWQGARMMFVMITSILFNIKRFLQYSIHSFSRQERPSLEMSIP